MYTDPPFSMTSISLANASKLLYRSIGHALFTDGHEMRKVFIRIVAELVLLKLTAARRVHAHGAEERRPVRMSFLRSCECRRVLAFLQRPTY